MKQDIIKLLNEDKWEEAIDLQENIYSNLNNNGNIFHYSCIRGNKKIISYYLELKSSKIYLSNTSGNTGAHLLAINGWYDILIEVVTKKPKFLGLKNNEDMFVYNFVVQDIDIFEKVLNIMKINEMEKYLNYEPRFGKTLLLNVINEMEEKDEKKYKMLDLLIKNNIDFTIPKKSQPLLFCILLNKKNTCLYLLKNVKNLDVNLLTDRQITPLIVSLTEEHYDIALKLIDMGADINYAGPENEYAPLNICIKKGNFNVIEKILTKNVNYNVKNSNLKTPVYQLIEHIQKNKEILKKEREMNIIKKIIKNSDMCNIDIDNITPMILLKKSKLMDEFESILNVKKDIECVNIDESNQIKLPEISQQRSEFGIFAANNTHVVLYILIILKIYNVCVVPVQYPNEEKQSLDKYSINICNYENIRETSLMNGLLSDYCNNFYSLMPFIIMWKNKNIYYINKNLPMYLSRTINSTKKFIILKITLVLGKTGSETLHANVVIYDKKRNTVIRFEPYGDWDLSDSYNLDNEIMKIFQKAIGSKKFKYMRPTDYLMKTKFQSASNGDLKKFKNYGDPGGFCLAWCFWFIELKMLNPEINENLLANNALIKIISNGEKNDTNPLLTHIRRYAKRLDELKTKLLEKIDINSHEAYKINTSNTNLKKITNYLEKYVVNKILK